MLIIIGNLFRKWIITLALFLSGWLFKIEMSKTSELDGLMDEAGYKEFLEKLEWYKDHTKKDVHLCVFEQFAIPSQS